MADYAETRGEVVASSVGKSQVVFGASTNMEERKRGVERSGSLKDVYFPDITYTYTVNGKSYENNSFWEERVQITQIEKIEPIVAQHPVGSWVTVYYDPQDPSKSHIGKLPEIAFGRWLMLGVGFVVVVIIGIVLLTTAL